MNRLGIARLARLTLITLLGLAVGGEPLSAQEDYVRWRYDLDQAKQEAVDQKKLILLHFSASWCTACKELDRFVFVNPMTVRTIHEKTIPVNVDIDVHQNLAREFQVESVPYDVIITPAGHVLSERTSPRTADGYQQLIATSHSIAGNLSEKVVQQVAEIRQEMKRQQLAREHREADSNSFGSMSQSDANIENPEYKTNPNAVVPQFQSPQKWDTSTHPQESVVHVSAPKTPSVDAVRSSPFRVPSPPSSQQSSTQATPSGHSPKTAVNARSSRFTTQSSTLRPESERRENSESIPRVVESDRFSEASGDTRMVNDFVPENNRPAADQRSVADRATTGPASTDSGEFSAKPSSSLVAETESHEAEGPLESGLNGYCCVTLIEEQKWVKGKEAFGCIHRGRLYLFASEAYRDQFLDSPDLYSPLLGGADPVEFKTSGKLVDGQRQFGVFYGDEGPPIIVLFANQKNRDRFESDPSGYIKTVRQAMSMLDEQKMR